PTMPLPSYARVTNLRSGAAVTVRVNDRGPFRDGRVIDLSYAAAMRLGIAANGTGEVEVRRITHREIAGAAAPAPQEVAADRVQAEVVAGEFAAEYRIPGPATVPADSQPHQFAVGEHTLTARLAVRSVPKVAPVGYLLARATFQGEAALLPGPVSLFRGDAYIGRVNLSLIRPGEDLDLSFGADDRVRIEYAFDTGERSRKGIFEKRRRVERRYRVKVANHHGRPMEITVLDQLPVPQDERIRVELLDDATPPTERDPEGVRGVLAWRRTYAPGEEVTLLFGYAVSYPEGETVPGF
ncbi:MAG: mucoidy inhibitor MuiA family protein, partial [Proteobacteria bacterium]|nr:mucoidy inhibitor MuiA family protein [Pseudomonadota bacterium]